MNQRIQQRLPQGGDEPLVVLPLRLVEQAQLLPVSVEQAAGGGYKGDGIGRRLDLTQLDAEPSGQAVCSGFWQKTAAVRSGLL